MKYIDIATICEQHKRGEWRYKTEDVNNKTSNAVLRKERERQMDVRKKNKGNTQEGT